MVLGRGRQEDYRMVEEQKAFRKVWTAEWC